MATETWTNRIVSQGTENPTNLLANPFNFRRHPKDQLRALEGALDTIGWVQNVIVNETTQHLIDGHARVELAMRKGETEIPVVYVRLSEAEEKIALATLDPIGGLAATDDELLQSLLDGINTENDMLAEFLDSMRDGADAPGEGLTDEDDAPAPPPDPIVSAGELWTLGDHRLLVGDTTKEPDVARLMAGEAADMVWTDPPYNVDYEGGTGAKTKIENDKMADSEFLQFLCRSTASMADHTKKGGCVYVAHADSEGKNFRSAYEIAGLDLKQCLIWAKSSATLSRQDYNWHHEPILYGWKPGAGHYFAGDFTLTTLIDDDADIDQLSKDQLMAIAQAVRDFGTVLREDKPHENKLHPTMKPVALVRRCIIASSRPGEIVLDGFGGSGTTLIACETVGRKARIVEFDPVFAQVIIDRWQDFTGQAAQREDGATLASLELEAA